MKKLVTLFLLVYLILFLGACGNSLEDSLSEIENEVSQEQVDEKDESEESNEKENIENENEESKQEEMTRDQAYEITTDLIDEANEIGSDFRDDKEVLDIVDDDNIEQYENELQHLLEKVAVGEGLEKLTDIISYEYLQTLYLASSLETEMIDTQFEVLEHLKEENEERLHISYATLETEMGSTPTGVTDVQMVKDDQWKISDIGETSFEEQPLNLTEEDVEEMGHDFIEELEHEGETYLVYQDKDSDFVWYRHKQDSSIAYEVKEIYENDQAEESEDMAETEDNNGQDESQESDETNESYLSQLEWPSDIELESYHVENADEYLEFEYEYPIFDHALLDELIDERVTSFKDRWGYVEDLINNNETMPGGQATSLGFAPPYTYNDDRISMFMRTYIYEGGVHGQSIHNALNYDLETGEPISLSEQLAELGISEDEFVEESINQLEQYEHADGFYDDWKVAVANDDIDQLPYAVSDTTLSIRYPAYYLGPYSIGYPLIDIPLE